MTLELKRLPILLAGALSLAACSDDSGTNPPPPDPCDANPASCAATLGADITANRTLYADTVYTLTDYVHVTGEGTTLTIQPGTVIRGNLGSALFVLPGARIDAVGRADAPIVFTSAQPAGNRRPGDWGGLVIVGKGQINRTGEVQLEGTNSSERNYKVVYSGGTNNADNSGRLSYVRVEFAGFGVANNQELNSVTLAAVGSGTQLDHVQTLAGLDDSFEWFGGAVDGKYLVSYESGDDHFDASEGYVGRNQFLVAYQSGLLRPRQGSGVASGDPQGFEVDGCDGSGCTNGQGSTPLTIPMFANFTLVGSGPNTGVEGTSGGVGMVIRRGAGGHYVNGVVARWPRAALSLRNTETEARLAANELTVRNIYTVQNGVTAGQNTPLFEGGADRFTIDAAANQITSAAGTVTAASLFTALPAVAAQPANAAAFDWSLASATGPVATGGTGAFTGVLATRAGTFVSGTAYVGAAAPGGGDKWWQGWTYYEFPAGQ